ncbi:thiosulfate sulfurtransferase GlpE [Spirabiliibacterium falconis]|uniref:thiosulfate sulfurtransferase GlpE n=1 Tax=Spirabiliibacterium falconis TaxID=572023 RepID=UPI001AAD5812|nr:thiosulfate sulfurtransferase GlpE [Spirabiliibacterium falconis]MBE2894464.1 thiosulfate sulfurtransferase GlpE [Spirabiliibacterium falconis]
MTQHVTPISPQHAWEMVKTAQGVLFDIRNSTHFAAQHAKYAQHLSNDNLHEQLNLLDFEQPVLIICYHGISSLSAGHYLASQGFEQVYSVEGGFEGWLNANLPVEP